MASLLGTEEMKALIKLLRDMADYVILDTAPAELLVDASLMARYADAALYVIRYDYTKMNKIRGGVEALALQKSRYYRLYLQRGCEPERRQIRLRLRNIRRAMAGMDTTADMDTTVITVTMEN